MKFRLTSILWVFALLAAAMAAFGPALGIGAALLVFAFWSDVLYLRRIVPAEWLVILVILATLIALLIPAIQSPREAARRTQCQHQLRQLARALMNRVEQRGAFPPAAGAGSNGAAVMSWRVAMLPQLDQYPTFQAYRQNEPWNGPTNRNLAPPSYYVFCCPSDPNLTSPTPATTNYFGVVGNHAAWAPDRGRRLDDFQDDRATTILLLEVADRNTPWSKPEDLSFDEALALLTDPPPGATTHDYDGRLSYFDRSAVVPGMHVAFADGSICFLHLPLSREFASALLTIDGGETIDEREFDRVTQPQLDYAKIYGHAVFALLAFLPASRLIRRRKTPPLAA
jgi:type II secretory pathway pseudopilin PulG